VPLTSLGRRLPAKPGRFAWIGLGLVLSFLAAFALWIALASSAAGAAVRSASILSDAYRQARSAVADEDSLEQRYRLEPDRVVRGHYQDSAASLVGALDDAQRAGTADDARLVADVLRLHNAYRLAVNHLFAAVDAKDVDKVLQIDETEVDPLFNQIESLVTEAADSHREAAASELRNLGQTDAIILAATPAVFLLGFVILLLFRAAFRTFERRLEAGSRRELAQAQMGEQRFRSLVQNAADTVVILDPAGLVTYCSPAIERNWAFSFALAKLRRLREAFFDPRLPERCLASGGFGRLIAVVVERQRSHALATDVEGAKGGILSTKSR
jgi:PAS domain-containing protein